MTTTTSLTQGHSYMAPTIRFTAEKAIITFDNGVVVQAGTEGPNGVELDILIDDIIGGYLYADNTGFYVGANSGCPDIFLQAATDSNINVQFNGQTKIVMNKDGITAPAFHVVP